MNPSLSQIPSTFETGALVHNYILLGTEKVSLMTLCNQNESDGGVFVLIVLTESGILGIALKISTNLIVLSLYFLLLTNIRTPQERIIPTQIE